MTRSRAALALLAATLFLAQRTSADASARLVYVRDAAAAAACPDERALRRAVELRLGYDPFLPWGSATIVVRFDRDGPGFVARVEMVSGGASRGARTLRSDDPGCGGLVDAAALAVSIALDAQQAPVPPTLPNGTSQAQPGAGKDQAPTESPQPPPNAVEAPPSPAEDAASPPAPLPPAGARVRFRPVIGLDALVSVWSAPSVSPGLSAWGRLQTERWSLGIEARADLPMAGEEPGGNITTWLVAGGLAPCFHLGWAFGCAVGELGYLRGWGGTQPTPGSAIFAAAGPRVGVELPVTKWASLRLRADFLLNLAPTTVELNHNPSDEWQAQRVTGTLGGGLAVRFP